MKIDHRDKRFGIVAVEQGFITKEQLFEAIKLQTEENLEQEEHSLIGVILYRLGYLTKHQIDKILGAMRERKEEGGG